ncbi:hypothetical protein PF007_g11992 [Phytophthora fragariae]|uniref:Uncharacterized protein n=1 Tax=Phytophthora fragariae TaxID=53985 RepID=A0A6A3S5X9_9STRA|nr:hypothetical protein PF007_g11992 [Phytophthora fragariae]
MSSWVVLSSVATSLANSRHAIASVLSLLSFTGLMVTKWSFFILPNSRFSDTTGP